LSAWLKDALLSVNANVDLTVIRDLHDLEGANVIRALSRKRWMVSSAGSTYGRAPLERGFGALTSRRLARRLRGQVDAA
jgi:allophanate hydrolase subunit 1